MLLSDNIYNKNVFVRGCHPAKTTSTNPPVSLQTYAQATSNSYSNSVRISPPGVNKIISSFLNDFKQLINPLIALVTKVILSLLDKKTINNNPYTDKSYLILLFNVTGLKNHANELQATVYNKRFGIALITKPHFTQYPILTVTNFLILII